MLFVLFVIIVSLFVYLKGFKPQQFWKNERIRHLKSYPFFGNMFNFTVGLDTLFYLPERLYNSFDKKYFGFMSYNEPVIVIKDLELIKNITIKDFEHFMDHKNPMNESNEPVFKDIIVSTKGQHWRNLRVTLSPAFTGRKMRAMFVLINECTNKFANYYAQSDKNYPIDIECKKMYGRLTIDIIATCVLGIESNSHENNEFYQKCADVSSFAGIRGLKMIGYLICPSLMRLLKVRFYSEDLINYFRNIISTTIEFREKNNIVRPDLIHLMVEARKGQLLYEESSKLDDTGFATIEESDIGKSSASNLEITDDVIVAQVLVFFLGGVESNSSSLSFISYELAVNPDIQKKLQDEIDSVYEQCEGQINYEAITKMKYMDMVISEGLRKWPPGFFIDRLCVKDYTIQPTNPGETSYTIKKGQPIWIPVVGYHKDPKYYPDPEKFDPERFNDENKKNINPYTYMPFGLGPRSCIGNRFALLVIKIALFHMLHKFNFVVTKKTDIPLKLSKFFLNAANGFWIGLEKRSIKQ